jgi:hypothetical protein
MKTTVELPDALFRQAKAVAARRGTTLKAVFLHALEREVRGYSPEEGLAFAVYDDGLPYLPPRGARVTSELVSKLLDEEES